jgi:hypothetical protein
VALPVVVLKVEDVEPAMALDWLLLQVTVEESAVVTFVY